MNCPHCHATLVIAERSGVEIDYCPQCRGVWLDRGELDKILDRAASAFDRDDDDRRPAPMPDPRYGQPQYGQPQYPQKRKRGGFLGEIFDFD